MDSDSCVIRNYCSADLGQYVRLHAEAESICGSVDTFLLGWLTGESLKPTDFSGENLFLAEEQGRIVGACRVIPELAIGRAVLRLLVRPGFLGRRVTAGLLRSAIKRASDLKAAIVHADLRENDRAARNLFADLEFRPVRRYAEMRLELWPALVVESKYIGLSHRPLEPGAETEFTLLQNRAFGESWGFCPNTTSEIFQQLNTCGYGHNGVILTYYGEDAAGYCWTAKVHRPDGKTGEVVGRIHMMGIVPEFRGRGLGRSVLWSGLKYLAGRGLQTVELTVDCQNEAACSLYKRAGFKLKTALVWYEKRTGLAASQV
ncbi:GNAT family N-acetyltransferase [Candidatus Poribacteria bacterium]|nr:GNAT family N-acetyltransferase [Candidatus Poribacteria bacterium]